MNSQYINKVLAACNWFVLSDFLPAAFREAEIACRAVIRQKRKDKQEHDNLLQGLYMLSALEGFCFATPYIEEIGFPAYSVVELIPRNLLLGLHIPYSEIGYKHIPASVTDAKWFVAAWGEPDDHKDPQKYHEKLWQTATQNFRNKMGGLQQDQKAGVSTGFGKKVTQKVTQI